MEKAKKARSIAGFWLGRAIVLAFLIGSGYWGFYYLPPKVPWWQAIFGPPALVFIVLLVLGVPQQMRARGREIVVWAAAGVVILVVVSIIWNWSFDWSRPIDESECRRLLTALGYSEEEFPRLLQETETCMSKEKTTELMALGTPIPECLDGECRFADAQYAAFVRSNGEPTFAGWLDERTLQLEAYGQFQLDRSRLGLRGTLWILAVMVFIELLSFGVQSINVPSWAKALFYLAIAGIMGLFYALGGGSLLVLPYEVEQGRELLNFFIWVGIGVYLASGFLVQVARALVGGLPAQARGFGQFGVSIVFSPIVVYLVGPLIVAGAVMPTALVPLGVLLFGVVAGQLVAQLLQKAASELLNSL